MSVSDVNKVAHVSKLYLLINFFNLFLVMSV